MVIGEMGGLGERGGLGEMGGLGERGGLGESGYTLTKVNDERTLSTNGRTNGRTRRF